jgi:hypothetical protein
VSLECEGRVDRGRVCSEGERVLEAPRTKGSCFLLFCQVEREGRSLGCSRNCHDTTGWMDGCGGGEDDMYGDIHPQSMRFEFPSIDEKEETEC